MLRDYIDEQAFEQARERIVGRLHNDKGIGTLREKSVHGILKFYYEPDEDCHEVALAGYVADIFNEQEGVIEIQTRNMDKMRSKLAIFLNLYPVTVVYPMPFRKWVSWIDPETGVISKLRKAPKIWSPYEAFYELYKIKPYLTHPNLRIRIVMMNMEEYRMLNGWNATRKRGAARVDRIPLTIEREYIIDQVEDYLQFVPYELEEDFTSSDFAKAAKIAVDTARQALNILYGTGTVLRVGKRGNTYLYRVNGI